jgi:hypothetical protein
LLVRGESDFRAKGDVNGARNATEVDATPMTTINNNERGMIAPILPSNVGKCDRKWIEDDEQAIIWVANVERVSSKYSLFCRLKNHFRVTLTTHL